MATQDQKDWEDYQLGQQGTSTGSMHNTMGLNDRPNQQPASTPRREAKKQQNQTSKSQTKAAVNNDFNALFAIVAFIATALYMYKIVGESGMVSIIVASIAAILAGKLYKLIIGAALLIGALLIFGAFNNGAA